MSISVIIVDDHKIIRDGLKTLLSKEIDIDVVGEAENGREAIKITLEKRPDIVIMDIGMPVMNGIEATRQIVKDLPETKIIALSMHYDKQYVKGMLFSGAKGYLLKDCAGEELSEAIRTVSENNTYISQDITNTVIEGYSELQEASKSRVKAELTNREKEILQLLTEGDSTKQIAIELYISVKTVEAHRANIMGKLNIHNLPELTKYAIRHGFTSVDK